MTGACLLLRISGIVRIPCCVFSSLALTDERALAVFTNHNLHNAPLSAGNKSLTQGRSKQTRVASRLESRTIIYHPELHPLLQAAAERQQELSGRAHLLI